MNHTQRLAALVLALGIDLTLGDPPNRLHPVAWMGNLIQFARRHCPYDHPIAELAYGTVLVTGGSLGAVILGDIFEQLLDKLPAACRIIGTAVILKATFSVRGLDRAAREVQAALEAGDLSAARRLLAWSLVSRDTSKLNESQVASAAIESVAENASDSLIAPLCYYTLGGLPLALVYRFANTADAMLGYHTTELEWLGKVPARIDDLLNLLPARLTGWLIVFAAPFGSGNLPRATQTMLHDAGNTASPNAGYPMSAMAGALGVELEKIDAYRLSPGAGKSASTDIQRARRILFGVVGIATGLFSLLQYFRMKTERKSHRNAVNKHGNWLVARRQ
jgi:adenosylcobinamide-phosphate synthase